MNDGLKVMKSLVLITKQEVLGTPYAKSTGFLVEDS